jgi:L-alanine-DL-glutamate epimerase-like enolase superfamily enzyme
MKITDIKCYVLKRSVHAPTYHWRQGLNMGAYAADESTHSALIKVETDEGIVGHVGAGNGYHMAEITRRQLRPEFVGCNPLLTEHIWQRSWEQHRWGVREMGLMDVACWDIKSQAAKMPLYQLLGGNNPKVAAYASTVTWDTMDEYEQHIKECMDEGFFAFKLHASGDPKWDAKLSLNLRKWVGDGPDLMFDASGGWDYVTSLWFGHVLEEADFLWYEEPMREYDLPSYTELCAALDIPILGAETSEGAHWNVASWIQQRALDMVRVSPGKGGYTGAIKIAHTAESFGMRAQLHGCDPHLAAAIRNNDYTEILVIDTEQIRGLKYRDEIRVVDGYTTTSDEPGVGPQPDWKKIEAEAVAVA